MKIQEFLLLLVSLVCSIGGQFFLKAGAVKLGRVNMNNALTHILSIVLTPELMTGLICYGLGAVLYILLLTRVDLSIVGPSISLTYVFSVLMGYFIFKEFIPITRVIGLGFIVCGVVLVIWKK